MAVLGDFETRVLTYNGKAVGISTPRMRNFNKDLIQGAIEADPIVARYFSKRIKWMIEETPKQTAKEKI